MSKALGKKTVLTVIWIGLGPELYMFRRIVFGPSIVLRIPKSITSSGEYIPGAERRYTSDINLRTTICEIIPYSIMSGLLSRRRTSTAPSEVTSA